MEKKVDVNKITKIEKELENLGVEKLSSSEVVKKFKNQRHQIKILLLPVLLNLMHQM
ncbi:hypothetical protein [Pseudobacteroides cellulosolvens]|uniref:Uncharacterized protein n=1 Tax=Pseudobacteroides cellulosolvens ATCC 35603 = DSM 2933 TaxID=398512 RepID=A0A0L6JI91_9FIRM|nr:hypothetical protein [Pseudobacteroides cellulosolvens]KNY25187.1 hypothetical protein Bccel_0444 [Pseudobacteroides cellulosolvens ATCC 35603 = DSM 2933]